MHTCEPATIPMVHAKLRLSREVEVAKTCAAPPPRKQVGLALVPESVRGPEQPTGKKGHGQVDAKKSTNCDELSPHAFERSWVGEGELEVGSAPDSSAVGHEHPPRAPPPPPPSSPAQPRPSPHPQIKYIATTAGFNDLFLWAEMTGGERVRVPLPGTPFSLAVTSGKGNIANSKVTGYVRESEAERINGVWPGGKWSVRQVRQTGPQMTRPPCTLHPAPPHPASWFILCTLHPAPCTPHPASWSILCHHPHPSPSTLLPAPSPLSLLLWTLSAPTLPALALALPLTHAPLAAYPHSPPSTRATPP